MRLVFVFVVAGILGVSWAVSSQSLDPATVREPAVAPGINLGKMTYQAFCQVCHGVNAVGTESGPTFLNRIYLPAHHGDASYFVAATRGVQAHHWNFGDMPPVDGINAAQLRNIVAYIRALQTVNNVR